MRNSIINIYPGKEITKIIPDNQPSSNVLMYYIKDKIKSSYSKFGVKKNNIEFSANCIDSIFFSVTDEELEELQNIIHKCEESLEHKRVMVYEYIVGAIIVALIPFSFLKRYTAC